MLKDRGTYLLEIGVLQALCMGDNVLQHRHGLSEIVKDATDLPAQLHDHAPFVWPPCQSNPMSAFVLASAQTGTGSQAGGLDWSGPADARDTC